MKVSELSHTRDTRLMEGRILRIQMDAFWTEIAKERLPASDFACGFRTLLGIHMVDGEEVENDEAHYVAHRNLLFAEMYGICYSAYGEDESHLESVDLASCIPTNTERVIHVGENVKLSGILYRKFFESGRGLSLPNKEPLFTISKGIFIQPNHQVHVAELSNETITAS